MRFGQWIGIFLFIISFYIIWQIRQILLIVFASIVLATVLNNFVTFLQRFRVKRSIAIFITISLLLFIIFGFFIIIVPQIIEQLQQLSNLIPMALDRIRLWNNWLIKVIPNDVLENIRNLRYLTQNLQLWLNRLFNNFFFLISSSLTIVLGLLLLLALTVMLMAHPKHYRRGFILLFPAFYRQRINIILNKCATSLTGWIRGTLLTMLLISIFSYIGLSILGVPLALINAILAGLLEFIPNVGPTLSVFPPALLALADSPWKAVAVVVLYFIIQQVESLIIVPWVMKTQVSLLPAVTLLSVVIFGTFFGFLGVFLAVPLVIVLQIWIQEVLVKDILNNWKNHSS
ncbi:AI-2E family transporter [Anabaena minutissima FACHB-250]|nr:AI-2E family transporter [Anabaena minutissima FACHB-250]